MPPFRSEAFEHLKLLLAQLRRMQFGRKSERLERQIEQLELKLETLQAERAEAAPRSPASLSETAGTATANNQDVVRYRRIFPAGFRNT
jgi:transposase